MTKKITFFVAILLVTMLFGFKSNVNAAVPVLTSVEVNRATLTLTEGEQDSSIFTAQPAIPELYTVLWECWDDNTNETPYALMSTNDGTYTFSKNNSYSHRICIQLTPEAQADGYTFCDNTVLLLNGDEYRYDENLGTSLVFTSVRRVSPEALDDELETIDVVKVTGANFYLYDGLVPTIKTEEGSIFTAVSEEPDKYYVYVEMWRDSLNGNTFTSSSFFNDDGHTNNGETLLKVFEGGKSYYYSVWVKPEEGYKFDENTKLILNDIDFVFNSDRDVLFDEENLWFEPFVSEATSSNEEENDEYTNIYEEIPVHIFEVECEDYYSMEETATLEVNEDTKISYVACLDIDYDYFVYCEMDLKDGYDAGAMLYLNSVYLNVDEDYYTAKLTIPVPKIYDNKTVMLVIDDIEYLPISITDGYATFEIPLTNYYNFMPMALTDESDEYEDFEYGLYGEIYFKYAVEEPAVEEVVEVEEFEDVVTGDNVYSIAIMFVAFAFITLGSVLKLKKSI